FRLADSRSELGAALALGPRVIVVFDGVAYEVVDSSDPGDPLELPAEQSLEDSIPPSEIDPGAQPDQPAGLPCLAELFGFAFLPIRRRVKSRGSELGVGSREVSGSKPELR
ncbi:MAG: hypothetical protein ACRDHG_06025, partial [Anaerolineales bacterium]